MDLRGRRQQVTAEHCVFLAKYCTRNQIKKNEIRKACSTYGERRAAYKVLVEKSGGDRTT